MAVAGVSSPPDAGACAPQARGLASAWAITYAAVWALTLGAATILCIIPGGPALARGLLHLRLLATSNPRPSLTGAASIAINNTLHSTWPLSLGPLGARSKRITRALADAAVSANLLVCALLVGGALAGYGTAVIAYLPHVPLEWAGVAAGASGWLIERRRPLRRRERITIVLVTLVLLLCAAAVETCLVPHR